MNVYLLEDDPSQLAHLKSYIIQISREIHINNLQIHSFQSTAQLRLALPLPSKKNVFILDLEINGYNQAGLDFSQTIRKYDQLASIIFITVHDEFVYTTYKYRVRALDFIAKDRGYVYQELLKDFVYIQKQLAARKSQDTFTYKMYSDETKIPLNHICYFEANHYNSHSSVMVTTDNQHIQINYNLRELEKAEPRFYRTHRSYLVNPQQIRSIDMLNRTIEFFNGVTCPVSRRHVKELTKLINGY